MSKSIAICVHNSLSQLAISSNTESIPVSSTTSCKCPAAITDALAPISLRRFATATGWIMYGSPLARNCPS